MRPPAPISPRWSWICRDQLERDRFLDMHTRIRPAHQRVLALLALLLAPTVPWDNPCTPLPLLAAVLGYGWAQHNATRRERPEVLVAAGLVFGQLMLTAAVVVNGSQHEPAIAILVWPLVAAGGRFPARVVAAFTAITAVLMVGASLGFDGGDVLHDPLLLTAPLGVMAAIVLMSAVIRESDAQHRTAALHDQLTGMLNRTALVARTAELERETAVTPRPVALVLGDVDHFKSVNDHHGHGVGDRVLRGIAARLRAELRAFAFAYRLGGEEFAVVVDGAEEHEAALLAERLREAISGAAVGGVPVTMSFGVAATDAATPFRWGEVYARADAALYDAKQAGRDRVRRAGMARVEASGPMAA